MKSVLIFAVIRRWDQYVPPMLHSVMEQSYDNFRFCIFITPQSKEYIEKYIEEKHTKRRDKVFFKEMSLASDEAERAKWFENMYEKMIPQYDYFTQVDGDDYIEKNYIQVLVETLEKENADIACAGIWTHSEHNIFTKDTSSEDKVYDMTESMEHFHKIIPYFRTVWGFLIKPEMVPHNMYETIPTRGEMGGNGIDTMISFRYIKNAKKIVVSKGVGYHYFIRSGSATRSFLSGRENVAQRLYQEYFDLLTTYTEEVSAENRTVALIDCSNSNVYSMKVLLDDTSISYEEKFEKFYFMATLQMMKEIISEIPGYVYRKYVTEYERVLVLFQEGHLELTHEKKEKLYEVFLVIWWRYKGRVPFSAYEEFLFEGEFLNEMVDGNDLSWEEAVGLYVKKKEAELVVLKISVLN